VQVIKIITTVTASQIEIISNTKYAYFRWALAPAKWLVYDNLLILC
jgi:hypothetical protein